MFTEVKRMQAIDFPCDFKLQKGSHGGKKNELQHKALSSALIGHGCPINDW